MRTLSLFFLCSILAIPCLFAQDNRTDLQEKLNKKQFREIISETGPLVAAGNAGAETLYIIGQAYEGLLKYREAYGIYQQCLEKDSLNLDLVNTLGRTAVNLGRAGEAEKYFIRVVENDSTNFYATYQLARLYFQMGDYEKAIDKYEELEADDPENPTILKNLGDCYIRLEDYNTGSTYYYYAYMNNKENAGIAYTLVNTFLRMGGDYIPEALEICDSALIYNPDNKNLLRSKAMGLYMNKNYNEADTLYTRLMEEGDSTLITLLYGGASRYYGGYPMNAIEPLEAAYEVDSTSVDVCLLLGASLGKTYDRKRAFQLFNEAEENMKPSKGLVLKLEQFRAETYHRDGNYEVSSRMFYKLWNENKERLDFLHKVLMRYTPAKIKDYSSENDKQRGLFLIILYVKEFLKANEDPGNLRFYRSLLKQFYEEMFFNSAREYTALSPDGKTSKVTVEEIKELLDRIPDTQ
ncbi:MAG: tetratricopeptide repeat protein [Tannerellaceae bacterium]|nr:tetratricopeptide repeat protein [Tannerellaceae bacterium]